MKPALRHIPPEYIRECFDMNERGELFWKARPPHHFARTSGEVWFAQCVGQRAGRINNRGYWMLTLHYRGHSYKVLNHRIVWLLTHGDWPRQFIDHINRVRADNRPSNLRDVSHAENMRNTTASGNRRDLPTGVYRTRSGRYRTQLQRDKEIHYFGVFDSSVEAAAAVAVGQQRIASSVSRTQGDRHVTEA